VAVASGAVYSAVDSEQRGADTSWPRKRQKYTRLPTAVYRLPAREKRCPQSAVPEPGAGGLPSTVAQLLPSAPGPTTCFRFRSRLRPPPVSDNPPNRG
jgi:hypothetical protein